MKKNIKKIEEVKHVYFELKERNGEYEYRHKIAREIPKKKNAEKFANDFAKDFYGSKPEKDGDGYYFNAGEVYVRVNQVHIITKEEFEVLTKYF